MSSRRNESGRLKPPPDENNYFISMPLSLHDKYDISNSTSRDQAFIQEYLYIYLIVKYKGSVGSTLYDNWKEHLQTLNIGVEVSSQDDKTEDLLPVDGMNQCRLYSAENSHPKHMSDDYFKPQITSEGHVLFPLCTSLGGLSPNSKRAKLLFTGIQNQKGNIDNIIESFATGRNLQSYLKNPMEFKVYVDIKLVNPINVYWSYLDTSDSTLLKIMITNTIQLPITAKSLQVYPSKQEGDCVLRPVSHLPMPLKLGPLEQVVLIYRVVQNNHSAGYCVQVVWTAEPIGSRGQTVSSYYELPLNID
eukprot:sb/3467257/